MDGDIALDVAAFSAGAGSRAEEITVTHQPDNRAEDRNDSWLDGPPTWVRVVQAILVGLVAGLALHALLSLVVLQGSEGATVPKECWKGSPTKPQPLKPAGAIRPAV